MRAAIARPYSRPTSSAIVAGLLDGQALERARRAAWRAGRRGGAGTRGGCRRPRRGSASTAGRPISWRASSTSRYPPPASFSRWWRATLGWRANPLGDLGRGRALGAGPHEEVDVAAGGIAEGGGDGRDGRGELVRREVGVRHVGILPTQVVEIPRSRPMPTEHRGDSTRSGPSRTPRSTSRSSISTWCGGSP